MEGNGSRGEKCPANAREEREQLSVDDHNCHPARERRYQELRANPAGSAEKAAEPGKPHAKFLTPLQVEVVWRLSTGKDQLGPRNRPMDDVRPDKRPKLPALKVRPMQRFVEEYTIAGLAKAVTEFDILDRGPGEASLVETTHALERGASDGAAPCPEGGCFFPAGLVYEMMQ